MVELCFNDRWHSLFRTSFERQKTTTFDFPKELA